MWGRASGDGNGVDVEVSAEVEVGGDDRGDRGGWWQLLLVPLAVRTDGINW